MADYARNKTFFASSTSLMLVIAAYMSFSLFWHDPIPGAWRIPLTAGLFLLSQSITGMRVLITRRPDLSFRLVRIGGFISASFMVLSWLVLLRDTVLALSFVLAFLNGTMDALRQGLFHTALSVHAELGMALASPLLALAGMAHALRVPPVRELTLPIPGLPAGLDGPRLVQLSDLHIGSTFGGDWLKEVVQRSNALRPDLVLITGDLADGSPDRIGHHLLPLTELRTRYGVFVTPGNHDYYSGLAPWVRTWRDWGLTVLLNEHRDLIVQGRILRIAGVTDPCAILFRSLSPEMGPPDSRAALRSSQRADFTILLSHRPGDAEQNAALGVDLQLSGHTHGGQFFFLFPLVTRMNRGFRSGLYRAGSMPLYVSPGTGMWGYVPMRFGSNSEITLITLRKKD